MKQRRMLGLVVALGALTVVLSTASHWLLRAHALDYAGRDLERLAQEVAYELDRQLVEWGRDINQLGDVLSGMRYDGDGERWSVQLQRYQTIHPRYRWIGVLNDMGRVVAATNPATIQSDVRHTHLVENPDTVQVRKIYGIQSDILSGGQDEVEVKHPMTAESLIDADKGFRGLIVGRIAVDSIREVVARILQVQATMGHGRKTPEFQILNDSGRVIADSNPKEDEPVNLLALGVTSARALASGESGFVQEQHGRRHVAVVTGYAPMSSKLSLRAEGWHVLIRLDNESILGELYPWSTMIVILSSLTGLILTLALQWSILQLQRHGNDAEAAKQVALENKEFLQLALDTLTSHIAILDERATILTVNGAWKQFGAQNMFRDSNHGIGRNYLKVCEGAVGEGSEWAHYVAEAIKEILEGRHDRLSIQYECHAPSEQRWFVVRISKFSIGPMLRLVVDHQDITDTCLIMRALGQNEETLQTTIHNALEARGRAEQLYNEKQALLAAVQVFFVRLTASGVVSEWTTQAEKLLGIPHTEAIESAFLDLSIHWDWKAVSKAIDRVSQTLITVHLSKVRVARPGDRERFFKLTLSPLTNGTTVDIVLMGEDITEHLLLEQELAQVHKLESIGQLAAGIAHEINTPTQFVGDNLRFFSDSFRDITTVIGQHQAVLRAVKAGSCSKDLIATCEKESQRVDFEFLVDEIPKAITQSIEGTTRIASIVRAMKEFAHPGNDEKVCVDLNKAIESTVTVARNEWKYVADLRTDLAPSLPPVPCLVGQFNQVILNMIVNATHAIADVTKGTGTKGTISITTRAVGRWVEIRIADSGAGIPEEIRSKIFDPFFTTKGVGKGTGQGLAIAHSVVIEKHHGTITLESEVGRGTTFIVRLPLEASTTTSAIEMAA